MSKSLNEKYPYLEFDVIDYIYNYTEDQYITTDKLLEYIKEKHGLNEFDQLMDEANRRFVYEKNNKQIIRHEFEGHMPIEYVRDIILSCFFLSSLSLSNTKFKSCTYMTLDAKSLKEYGILFFNLTTEDTHNVRVSDMEYIVSTDGNMLFAGFKFRTNKECKSSRLKDKYLYTRIFGPGTELKMKIGGEPDKNITDYIQILHTGIDGITKYQYDGSDL